MERRRLKPLGRGRPRSQDFETWRLRKGVLAAPQSVGMRAYGGLLTALSKSNGPDSIVLDFSKTEHAYPEGLLPILSLVSTFRSMGCRVDWMPPTDKDVRGVFDGLNWSFYLDNRLADPPMPKRTRSFVPARSYSTEEEANKLCLRSIDILISQATYAKWVPDALYWAMWEILENPIRHARSAQPAWFQAVSFPSKKQLTFVVVDSGIGILNSLREGYPDLKSDQQAIRKAVEFGATRDKRVGQGNGLAGCRSIAEANRGALTIWSGDGSFEQSGSDISRGPVGIRHAGTIVELKLRYDVSIDLPSVLGLPDFIPMAELDQLRPSGDSTVFRVVDEVDGFGSRRDGAALRAKIENIRQGAPDLPITVDFTDVPMISSSFADEALGKLAQKMGRDAFFRDIKLICARESISALVRGAVGRRLDALDPRTLSTTQSS